MACPVSHTRGVHFEFCKLGITKSPYPYFDSREVVCHNGKSMGARTKRLDFDLRSATYLLYNAGKFYLQASTSSSVKWVNGTCDLVTSHIGY